MKVSVGGVDISNSVIGSSVGRNWEVEERTLAEVMGAVREYGLWEGVWGKSFFELVVDFLKELGHDIAYFVVGNGDIFFLFPAILIIMATFFIGRNKYTKFTIPFIFVYFLSTFFKNFL